MSYIQNFFTSRDNNANAETYVGQEGRLWWDPVTNQIYSSDGNTPGGIPLAGGGGGNGSPGGSNTAVQFNNSGNFGGTTSFTYDAVTGVLSLVGNVAASYFVGDGSALTNLPVTYSNANVTTYLPTYTGNLAALTGNVVTTANVSGSYILGNGSQLTGIASTYGNANVAAYLPTYHGNLSPDYVDVSSNLSVGGSATVGGNLFVTGNINFSGNVNQISGNSGSFFGNAAGVGALYTGVPVGYSNVITAVIQATSNLNDYTQINAQNLSHGNTASMEYVITADTGTDTTNYLDIGIASSGWDGTQTNSLGNAVAALDGYLYVQGGVSGGNLIIGTTSAGKTIKFNAGGPNLQNTIAVISNTGFSTAGNVTGNYILGNGSQLTGIAASYSNVDVAAYLASGTDTSNIITTANIRSGNISTGNITANNLPLNANANIFSSGTSSIQVATVTATSQISSVGAVRAATIMSAAGNVTGGNVTTAGQISATGNITSAANITSGNISAIGSVNLGGQISAVGNITGGNLLTGANVSAFGNVTGGNIITGGVITTVSNVVANYFVGNGAALYAVNGSNVTGTVGLATSAATAGTVTTAAQPNITSVGTLTTVVSTGNISTTGNISGNYFIGNGSLLTGIATSYGNANVVANLASLGSNPISTTGNITAGYFLGNGSALTSIAGANVTGTVANATYATTAGSTTQLVNGSYSLVLNSNGTMNVPANLINTGSNPVGFWSTDTVTSYWRSPTGGGAGLPFQSMTAMSNTGVILTFLSGTANILVAKAWTFGFNGDLTFPDATVQTTAFTGTATSATTAGTVTTNAQPNITSVGTLTSITSTGNISTTGNVTGNYFIGNGSTLTSLTGANVTGTVANATYAASAGSATTAGTVTTNAQPNITSVGTLSSLTVTANVTGGNVLTGGLISATGNVTSAANIAGGNLIGTLVGNLTGTTASLSGNVIGGNVLSNGQLSAAGNITGGNISIGGNFSTPGNIGASWVNGAYYTGTWGTNFLALGNVSATGNVISTGAVYSNYNTNTANTGSFMAAGGNTKGGTGYLDFLVARNTSGGATNPYKWFRMNSTGGFEIINSAYTQNLFNLEDSGTLTIPGPFNIGGKQAVNGPAFSAYAAAILQTIPNNTQTKVLFQTEEFDTNGNYANSRFTPTIEGYYQLNAEVRLDGSSGTGEMMIILYKNGGEYKRGTNQSGTQIASNFWAMTVSSVAYANGSTDYFEIYVQQGSGADRTVTAVNNSAITWFNGCMLRGA